MTILGRAGAGVGSGVAPLKVPCRGPIPDNDNDNVKTFLLLSFLMDMKERCCLAAKCCCHPAGKIVYISVTAKVAHSLQPDLGVSPCP